MAAIQAIQAIRPGTVVAGKSKPEELIPALLSELERLDYNARLYGAARADEIRTAIGRDPQWWQSSEAELVLEELICALSDCAGSDEVYFGRRSLGSSEFGFWRCDD
jgi:hypothetical protein